MHKFIKSYLMALRDIKNNFDFKWRIGETY